jgi:hypothetical protein
MEGYNTKEYTEFVDEEEEEDEKYAKFEPLPQEEEFDDE